MALAIDPLGAPSHDEEVAQKQMQDELRESLEAQRVMFQEAAQRQEQAAEQAAQRQVKEAKKFNSKGLIEGSIAKTI